MRCYRLTALLATLGLLHAASIAHVRAQAQLPESPVVSPVQVIPLQADPDVGEPPVVTGVAFNRTGRLLAICGDDHLAHVYDVNADQFTVALRGHADWVRAIDFHPLENIVVTGGDDGTIRLWNADDGTSLASVDTEAQAIYQLAFRPDGQMLAHTGFDNKLRVHDGATGELLFELECPSNDVRAMAFSSDNRLIAAAGRNGTVRIWKLEDRSIVRDITASRRRIRAIVFTEDASQIATSHEDRELRIWRVDDGGLATSLPRQPGLMLALRFCGADHLASGSTTNHLQLWHIPSRQVVQNLVGHTGSIASIDFQPDTGLLVSGSFDTTVRLWSLPGISGPAAALPPPPGGILLR